MTAQQLRPVLSGNKIQRELPITPVHTSQKQLILRFIQEEIAALDNNWDGYGACPIEKNVLINATYLINNLPNNVVNRLDKDRVLPNSNGTISIEWVNKTHELFLEIGNNYATYYLKNKEKLEKTNNHFIITNPVEFRQFIKDLKSCLL